MGYFYTSRHHWKSDLNTYRVEAAWKLGRWDLLEDYLGSGNIILKNLLRSDAFVVQRYCFFYSLGSQSSTWGVQLGKLLLSAKKQDEGTFYQKLKLVRKEQVVPLSAASYERGAGTYQRGYEYIVRSVENP